MNIPTVPTTADDEHMLPEKEAWLRSIGEVMTKIDKLVTDGLVEDRREECDHEITFTAEHWNALMAAVEAKEKAAQAYSDAEFARRDAAKAQPDMVPIYRPGLQALVAFADKAGNLITALAMFVADHGGEKWPSELEDAFTAAVDTRFKLLAVKQPKAGELQ